VAGPQGWRAKSTAGPIGRSVRPFCERICTYGRGLMPLTIAVARGTVVDSHWLAGLGRILMAENSDHNSEQIVGAVPVESGD
jgi:hypothetical protein